jgi:hypothetical protein
MSLDSTLKTRTSQGVGGWNLQLGYKFFSFSCFSLSVPLLLVDECYILVYRGTKENAMKTTNLDRSLLREVAAYVNLHYWEVIAQVCEVGVILSVEQWGKEPVQLGIVKTLADARAMLDGQAAKVF